MQESGWGPAGGDGFRALLQKQNPGRLIWPMRAYRDGSGVLTSIVRQWGILSNETWDFVEHQIGGERLQHYLVAASGDTSIARASAASMTAITTTAVTIPRPRVQGRVVALVPPLSVDATQDWRRYHADWGQSFETKPAVGG